MCVVCVYIGCVYGRVLNVCRYVCIVYIVFYVSCDCVYVVYVRARCVNSTFECMLCVKTKIPCQYQHEYLSH